MSGNGEHRDGDLLAAQRLRVRNVGAERPVIAEARSHAARRRIVPGVLGDGRVADRVLAMRPCSDLRRDILLLATGREHLGKLRGHMETVMPGATLCRVHVLGAGQKAIDQDKLRQ